MTTAQDLITSAARKAGILAEAQSLEAGINAQALATFNKMIARFQNNGIDFGLAKLNASDTVFIDDSDEEAVELQLQLRLMVNHRRNIPPGLSAAGKDALKELQAKYALIPEMELDLALTRRSDFDIIIGD